MICARCHGPQGQGTDDGPQIIANPHPLKGHKTALALFDFVSTEMPHDAPGSLQAQEYWDVLAFILDANKLLPDNTTLGPDNAATIKVGD
jgi:cytochrome c